MLEILHHVLHLIIEYSIVIFEIIGVVVLIISGIKGIIAYVQNKPVHLPLTKGLALGLEFLLVGEILNTVVVKNISDIVFIASLCGVRMFLAVILGHEIETKQEAKMHKQLFQKKLESGNLEEGHH